jgi:hypothetical protein
MAAKLPFKKFTDKPDLDHLFFGLTGGIFEDFKKNSKPKVTYSRLECTHKKGSS